MKFIALAFIALIAVNTHANNTKLDFEAAIRLQEKMSYQYLQKNISPVDAHPGFIVASPSKSDPDYYYHWVRDAALVMNFIFEYEKDQSKKIKFFKDYVGLERIHQSKSKIADQGEPKFYTTTEPFQGPWGRPQNDGPAIRALANIKFAELLLQRSSPAISELYKSELPATTPIKIDLEYVSHQWKNPDFDLWEEVHGAHFFTRVVQLNSLEKGAALAKTLGDADAAKWYHSQAELIQRSMNKFWDAKKDYVVATVDQVGGRNEKVSQMDASVILGSFFRPLKTDFSITDPKILKTFFKITETFQKLYSINQVSDQTLISNTTWPALGVAIGRYPEDVYYGGHPWYLLTSTFAEFCYRQAVAIKQKKQGFVKMPNGLPWIKNNKAEDWKSLGDQFLARVLYHAGPQGELAEQFDRKNGRPLSAVHLSWSYSAYLSATLWRKKL
jgi:glucoamylase